MVHARIIVTTETRAAFTQAASALYRHLGSALVATDYTIVGLIQIRDGINSEALARQLRQLPGAQHVAIVRPHDASVESRAMFHRQRYASASRDQAWALAFLASPHYPADTSRAALDADAAEYAYEEAIAWPHVTPEPIVEAVAQRLAVLEPPSDRSAAGMEALTHQRDAYRRALQALCTCGSLEDVRQIAAAVLERHAQPDGDA